ncbi:MAG: hypothetical protein IJU07_05875 [Synergistaceae bacterium]|nr:hypothetical protein [Synergistaceae bacterium]
MEALLERPTKTTKWVKPTRKLTEDEIEDLIENYDYDPSIYDNDEYDDTTELDPIYDVYGNPTEATIRAMYESRHGIGEETTLDELLAWVDNL